MRKVMIFSCILFFMLNALAGANLLSNGNFELPGNGAVASDWTTWSWGNGWANTEQAGWGNGTWHIAVGASGSGGGGYYQVIPVTAGQEYELSLSSGADAWWLPMGTMSMIWLNTDQGDLTEPNSIVSEDSRNTVDPAVYGENYDIAHPWEDYSMTVTAPVGAYFVKVELTANYATGSTGFDDVDLSLTANPYPAYDPVPAHNATGVELDTDLSWTVSDPNGVVLPNLVSHKLYMSDGTDDPNLFFVADVPANWTGTPPIQTYDPAADLALDKRYMWRVDMVMDDDSVLTGATWSFYSKLSAPQITEQPEYQLVDEGKTAIFYVEASSVSEATYQWYKAGDPNTALTDGGDISGTATDTMLITNCEVTDEGTYYCTITNESGIEVVSDKAALIIKRKLAHWDFESASANSITAGSPTSVLYGDPVFVTGIIGDAMEFDADEEAEDMLYTDPASSDYFNSCNYNMTVVCWIKSTSAVNWAPMVARNGEENGWQLRQGNAGAAGDDRAVFTTRGLDVDDNDGIPGDRTVFDGEWHYVVGTYDGAYKKLYIDGVLSLTYTQTNGGGGVDISYTGEAATGMISASENDIAVSIAGRYGDDPAGVDNQFTAGVYDEVEIYNYALDATTIAQNYATVTGQAVCPGELENDLTGDCKVNLDDLAQLASGWLTDTSVQP